MDERQAQILEILDENYGEIGSGLNFHTPFELLVATILSAQSTDVRVNMVTPGLFAKYPTAFEMSQVSEEALAQEINSIGLYRNKSKSIIKASKMLVEKYHGEVPAEREKLQELPGVGRKTANVVLCNAFHIPAFAVDTHVFRVTQRLGFASTKQWKAWSSSSRRRSQKNSGAAPTIFSSGTGEKSARRSARCVMNVVCMTNVLPLMEEIILND